MKTTYDDEFGSAYIYFKPENTRARDSIEVEMPPHSPTDVNIDIDEAGEIIGIELLGVKYLADQLKKSSGLKTTYDDEFGSAYIYFKPENTRARDSIEVEMPPHSPTDVNIDIDEAGEIIGIELLGVKYLADQLNHRI